MLLTLVKNSVSSFVTQLLLHLRLHSWDLTLADVDGAAEDMPELSDGDDDDDVDDEEQWQWMEEDSQPVTCLFCDRWDHPALDLSVTAFLRMIGDTFTRILSFSDLKMLYLKEIV